MSTFLGLFSAGRPPPRFTVLHGLGADAGTKKVRKGSPAKSKAKAKAKEVVVKTRGGLRNQPLDNSHHPFKRDLVRPGGPKGVASQAGPRWECERRPLRGDEKDEYMNVQVCAAVWPDGSPRMLKTGPKKGQRQMKTVKVKRKYKGGKEGYNAQYRKHLKALGKPKFANKEHPGYSASKAKSKAGPAKKRVRAAKKTKKAAKAA